MAFYHRGKGNNTPREEGKWMKKGGKWGGRTSDDANMIYNQSGERRGGDIKR